MDHGKGRGGRREGAGRPKGDSRIYSFRCPGDLAARLDEQPSKTDFIRRSLTKALDGTDGKAVGVQPVYEASAVSESLPGAVPASSVKPLRLPYYEDMRVVAGFPVPLDNSEKTQDIELLTLLCPHPESSYLIRVEGESMIDAGLMSGDIVIVDKSNRNPSPKEIAMCELNGTYTLKRVVIEDGKAWLVPANPQFRKMPVTAEDEFSVWGTVTYIIHRARD